MTATNIPARLISESRALTAAQFLGPSEVPPELECLANIPNGKTRRAYQLDITDFSAFVSIHRPEEFRLITRAHVIAWRKDFERRELAPSTVRRELSALASLFECSRKTIRPGMETLYLPSTYMFSMLGGTRSTLNLQAVWRVPLWQD